MPVQQGRRGRRFPAIHTKVAWSIDVLQYLRSPKGVGRARYHAARKGHKRYDVPADQGQIDDFAVIDHSAERRAGCLQQRTSGSAIKRITAGAKARR
jgi:hypothetical protein